MAFHARVMSIRAPWSFEVIADLLAEYGEVHVSLKERSGLRSCAPSERPCLPKVLLLLSHLLHPSRATGEVDFSTAYPACQHMAHRADRRWSGVFTGSSSPLQRGMSASSLAPQASRLADRRSAVSLVPSQGTGDRGPTQAWNIYKLGISTSMRQRNQAVASRSGERRQLVRASTPQAQVNTTAKTRATGAVRRCLLSPSFSGSTRSSPHGTSPGSSDRSTAGRRETAPSNHAAILTLRKAKPKKVTSACSL